ncbi:MAG: DUF6159 family protein [Candidatus Hodarchaeota archaeon]
MAKVEKASHGRISVFLFVICFCALYAFGVYSFLDISTRYSTEINEFLDQLTPLLPLVSAGLPILILTFFVFFLIVLIMCWVILQIIKRTAVTVVIVMSYLFPILFIGIGVVLISSVTLAIFGAILVIIGVLMLLIALWNQRKLRRSGKFLEFSASLVLDEKALLMAPIILAIFTMFAGVLMGFSYLEIYDTWGVVTESMDPQMQDLGTIVGLVVEYVYLIVYFCFYYIIAGFICSYAFDWYRKEDPSLNTAWKDVKQVLAPIFWFAIIRATLEMITRLIGRGARRSQVGERRGKEQVGILIVFLIVAFISSILIGLYRFFTYFTLPAIVIKKKGLRDSIRDSAKMVWNSWLDVLVGETGFGLAMFFFNIVNFLLWGSVGFILGFTLFDNVIGAIVLAVVLLIISIIPMNIVSFPMGTAFKTFLYAYALDRSTGFKQPSRLPAELRGEFNDVITDLERRDVKRKVPKPTF